MSIHLFETKSVISEKSFEQIATNRWSNDPTQTQNVHEKSNNITIRLKAFKIFGSSKIWTFFLQKLFLRSNFE